MAGSDIAILLGRILIGGYFGINGAHHFTAEDELIEYAKGAGVPHAKTVVPLTGLMLIFGGGSLVLGILPAMGAALISLFLLLVTPTMHAFWELEGEERQQEFQHFMKNTALLGAMLLVMGAGSGVYTLT